MRRKRFHGANVKACRIQWECAKIKYCWFGTTPVAFHFRLPIFGGGYFSRTWTTPVNLSPFSNRQIRWALFRNLILQSDVVLPTVYCAVPRRDRAVTETTIAKQYLFCNRPSKKWSVAKLELQNNSCFAIEKNRYFPPRNENGWLLTVRLRSISVSFMIER